METKGFAWQRVHLFERSYFQLKKEDLVMMVFISIE
jgi:hypothetical protein